jgi:hypothetical protein
MKCVRDKGPIYHWIKYNLYKPIRSISEGIRYGYYFSEELQVESRRRFIEEVKRNAKRYSSKSVACNN